MRVEYLTSETDLEKALSECLNDEWTFEAEPTLLRVNFTNKDGSVTRTVRLGSLSSVSESLKKKIYDKCVRAVIK